MTVLDFRPNGIQSDEFLTKYDKQIKGKHGVYVIQLNKTNERHIMGSGKSYDLFRRILSYQQTYGKKTRTDPQAGVKVLYIKTVTMRKDGVQGQHPVDNLERDFNRLLAPKRVAGRGNEWYHGDIVNTVANTPISRAIPVPVRQSERVRKCLKWDVTSH